MTRERRPRRPAEGEGRRDGESSDRLSLRWFLAGLGVLAAAGVVLAAVVFFRTPGRQDVKEKFRRGLAYHGREWGEPAWAPPHRNADWCDTWTGCFRVSAPYHEPLATWYAEIYQGKYGGKRTVRVFSSPRFDEYAPVATMELEAGHVGFVNPRQSMTAGERDFYARLAGALDRALDDATR